MDFKYKKQHFGFKHFTVTHHYRQQMYSGGENKPCCRQENKAPVDQTKGALHTWVPLAYMSPFSSLCALNGSTFH